MSSSSPTQQSFYTNDKPSLLKIQSIDFEDTLSLSTSSTSLSSGKNENRLLGINQQSRSIKKSKKHSRKKKLTTIKVPNFKEDANPSQILNELRPGLSYTFELDHLNSLEIHYTCKIAINGCLYTGGGSSKKEAKRSCADKVLCALFPETYKKHVANDQESEMKKKIERLPKILNVSSIKTKSAAQLLNELDPVLARSGHFTSENAVNSEKVFIFVIELKEKHKTVKGYGKNKRIAKAEASKLAIKELYDVDIDRVLQTGIMMIEQHEHNQERTPVSPIPTTTLLIQKQQQQQQQQKTSNPFPRIGTFF